MEPRPTLDLNDPETNRLAKAALSRDPGDFYEAYLGRRDRGFMDIVFPYGRFGKADDLRSDLARAVLGQSMANSQNATAGDMASLGIQPPRDAFSSGTMEVNTGMPRQTGVEITPGRELLGPGAPIDVPVRFPQTAEMARPVGVRPPMGGTEESMPEGFNPLGYAKAVGNAAMGRDGWGFGNQPIQPQDEMGVREPVREPIGPWAGSAQSPQPQMTRVEGPRPREPVHETGIYSDTETVPYNEMNPNYKLTHAQQKVFEAETHRRGLREQARAGRGATAADLQAIAQNRLKELRMGARPDYKQELDDVLFEVGQYDKEKRWGSPAAGIERNQERITGAKADYAPQHEKAEVDSLKASAYLHNQEGQKIEELMDVTLYKMRAEIDKLGFDMSQGQRRAAMQKTASEMGLFANLFKYLRWVNDQDNMDEAGKLKLNKAAIDKIMPFMELEEEDRTGVMGGVKDFIGIPKKSTLKERDGVTRPNVEIPQLPKSDLDPGAAQQEAPEQKKERDFSGAPTKDKDGKPLKKGALLRDKSGKAIAQWNGTKWVE
jgi:hypothetical protein